MMDLNTAFELIDQALAEFRGNRQDHINLQLAFATVRQEVQRREDELGHGAPEASSTDNS